MRRSIRIPLILATLMTLGPLAPLALAAAPSRLPRQEIVTFVSRAELERQGLIRPTRSGARSVARAPCLWDCIYVTNRRHLRTLRPFVTMVKGNGPSTISIDLTRTVTNSFSSTVNVSVEVVSTGVGFNVQRSESVTYRSSTTVPSGACWSVRAYNVFFEYGFEIWQEPIIGSDTRIGSGTARDFRGIEFRLSKFC